MAWKLDNCWFEQGSRRDRLKGSQRQIDGLLAHDLLTLPAQYEAQEFGEHRIETVVAEPDTNLNRRLLDSGREMISEAVALFLDYAGRLSAIAPGVVSRIRYLDCAAPSYPVMNVGNRRSTSR